MIHGENEPSTIPGAAGAVLIAAGIACVAFGLVVVGGEASERIDELLGFWEPFGSLAGKGVVGTMVFAASWVTAHMALTGRSLSTSRVLLATLVLVGLGFLLTFPPFFTLFASQ